jgi:microcystin-dependent protein
MTASENIPNASELWAILREQRVQLAELQAKADELDHLKTELVREREAVMAPVADLSKRRPGEETGRARLTRRGLMAVAAGGAVGLAGLSVAAHPTPAYAAFEPYIGEIALFPYNFAPRGWAFCHGQLLSIAQNTALFSLLGTTYGGNGQTTFALPDLRGRVPVSSGQGPGLSNYTLGQSGGSESVTLTQSQMPAHTHSANAASGGGSSTSPDGRVWAASTARDNVYAGAANTTMAVQALGASGGSQPHDNTPPYLTLNYCIALEGIYPSRD